MNQETKLIENNDDSKVYKEITSIDSWKQRHNLEKKELELEKDKWKDKFLESDKENVDLKKELRQTKEELESKEREDLAYKKITSQDEIRQRRRNHEEQQVAKFLDRIK